MAAFVRDYAEYPIAHVRFARCTCGKDRFTVEIEGGNGARRRCVTCKRRKFVCDSKDTWGGEPDEAACPCGHEVFQLGAGFALYDDGADVRWIYVVLRCVRCKEIGVYEDWKIGYGPSLQLVDQV